MQRPSGGEPDMGCVYCCNEVSSGIVLTDDGVCHKICEDEWVVRARGGRCVRCGGMGVGRRYMCGGCTLQSPYVGYPPGVS